MALKTLSMLSNKNVQFTRLLKAEGTVREFNFRKTVNEGKVRFHVDVTDDRSNRLSFYMQKDDVDWKIQSQELPSWVIKSEKGLHDLIEQELQSWPPIAGVHSKKYSEEVKKWEVVVVTRRDIVSLVSEFHIDRIGTFGAHFHFKANPALLLNGFIAAINMHKNTLLVLGIPDKSISFWFIKKSHDALTN